MLLNKSVSCKIFCLLLHIFYTRYFMEYILVILWKYILVTKDIDHFASLQRISNIESNICLKKYEVRYDII